jgi:hypothetical protein
VHAVPHAPQFLGSNCVDVHIVPHRSGARRGQVHIPIVHPANIGHAIPQAPQLRASVAVFTHVPPHIIVPVGHDDAHIPFVQNCPAAQA